MTTNSARLLDQVLMLEPEERAEIASALIHSLDEVTDPDVEEAWAAEIQKRLKDIQDGVELLSWDDVRARIETKLRR